MNYDEWKQETPPDAPEGVCGYCGEACDGVFCSTECKKAYISEN